MNEYMDLNRADMQEILEHNQEITASKSLGTDHGSADKKVEPFSGVEEITLDNTLNQLNIV